MAEVDEMKIGCGIKAFSAEFVEIAGFDEVQTEILQPRQLMQCADDGGTLHGLYGLWESV